MKREPGRERLELPDDRRAATIGVAIALSTVLVVAALVGWWMSR